MHDHRDGLVGMFAGTLHRSRKRWNTIIEDDIHNRAAYRIHSARHWGGAMSFVHSTDRFIR
jgi:hypothetical protein